MNPQGYFITGTDTAVGKTYFTLALMAELQSQGKSVAGMKPVASGCKDLGQGLRSDDALQIMQQSSIEQDYSLVNPYAFAPAIAPHIAADEAGINIDLDQIIAAYAKLQSQSDVVVVEGVGGWRIPLGRHQFLNNLVERLQLPVILVVGLRLGCINHALLTAEIIRADGIKIIGWVANQVDPHYGNIETTLNTLNAELAMPLLGHFAYKTEHKIQDNAGLIDMHALLESGLKM